MRLFADRVDRTLNQAICHDILDFRVRVLVIFGGGAAEKKLAIIDEFLFMANKI